MEPGSSGSPLINSNRQIIGQLYGPGRCADITCGNPGSQVVAYGKFAISWAGGGATSSARRLKDWLDPINSNVTSLAGKRPTIEKDFVVRKMGRNTEYYNVNSGATITHQFSTYDTDVSIFIDHPHISSGTFRWTVGNNINLNWIYQQGSNVARAVALNSTARGYINLEVQLSTKKINLTFSVYSPTPSFSVQKDRDKITIKYENNPLEKETYIHDLERKKEKGIYSYSIIHLITGVNHTTGFFTLDNEYSEAQIDISNIYKGIYIFSICDEENKQIYSNKMVIDN